MKDINSDMKILIDILDSKEARVNRQKELLANYPYTLISFTLNIPGSVKNSNLYRKIHKEGMSVLLSKLNELNIPVVHLETIDKVTGEEGFISVDYDSVKTKNIVVNIEDTHYLGRIFDLDVFDVNHNHIGRSDIRKKPRKCLICDKDALVCMRLKSHGYDELVSRVKDIGKSYFKLRDENKTNETKSKLSMSEKVYIKIKNDILDNKLKPGEKLIEENLAEELNVSRTPVREALKQLDQDGLITYYPRRGSVVSQISIKDAQELYEVREALEGLAIKLICLNIDTQSLKILEDLVASMEEATLRNDYEKVKLLHSQWTEAILSLTKNDLLKSYLMSVTKNLGRLRKISLYEPEQSIDAYKETKDILRAIINNDSDESERLARLHVRNARKRFEKNLIQL